MPMLTTPTTCPWYIFNEIWLFLLHRYSQLCKRANSSTVWLPSCWLNISLCSVPHARFWMWRRRMDASCEDWRQKGVVSFVFVFFLPFSCHSWLAFISSLFASFTHFCQFSFYLLSTVALLPVRPIPNFDTKEKNRLTIRHGLMLL